MNQAEADEDRAPSEAEIEKTFYTRRLPRLPWSLLLVLYVPFGLFLTLLRVCMSLQAILLLAFFPEGAVKRFLLRVFFAVLGIIVITDSFHRKGSQTKVYIGNKVSHLDHIVLHLALDCITVGTGGAAPLLHFLFPHRQLSSHSPEALETEAKRLPEFDDSRSTEIFTPFVVQPEPIPTNGAYSLLQFCDWPCSLAQNVQPISLTARRPFGIKITTVHSSQWWDLLWTLFVPATVFHVKLLAPMERREGEEVSGLCERVQESLREELCLQRAEFTMDDVAAWLKATGKRAAVPSATATAPVQSQSPPPPPPASEPDWLERMVEQVSAVMPQVPTDTIRKDLLWTQNVDATITNFLEGVVAFDPVLPPTPPAPASQPPHSHPSLVSSSAPRLKTSNLRPQKHYSPAMQAMYRQLSLEERKAQLIQNARKRYIEKHNMNG